MIYIPSRMGQLNRRALLRQLQKQGVASRAELAKALGMSQPTAGKIVDELLAAEILEEIESTSNNATAVSGPGRPGRQLRLNWSKCPLLAIQLGLQETTIASLALGVSGEDQWQQSSTLDSNESDPARVWETRLRAAVRKIDKKHLRGVLLSVPGIVDESKNRILFSPNLHWTEKVDMAEIVRRVCDVPVLLVQEERALALGHLQINPGCDDLLLVDFGEGVGGAIIMEGKPLANPLPISGEIGHTPVFGNRRRCGCGAVGCMETMVSVRGLLASLPEAQKLKTPSWNGLREHIVRNGLPLWLARSLDAASMAIVGVLNVVGLQRVIITGSLFELPEVVVSHLSQAIQNGSIWAKFGTVQCVAAPRHRTAGLVAVGIDRLIVPDNKDAERDTDRKFSQS
jgi:predicted NBD/HSP70 family sugar kinase